MCKMGRREGTYSLIFIKNEISTGEVQIHYILGELCFLNINVREGSKETLFKSYVLLM